MDELNLPGANTPATPAAPGTAPNEAVHQPGGTETPGGETPPAEKTFTQAELDDILAKKTAKLIRQRDQERAQRTAIEQHVTRVAQPQGEEGKPQLAQFANPEQYADALANWKLNQVGRQQQVQQEQQTRSAYEAKRADLMADLEDAEGFDSRKFNQLPISRPMAEAILDSDAGVGLTLHLIAHPDEASRIAALPPARQAAELGKLEAKLSATPAKKPSNAPAPITPVGSKGSAVAADIYDARLQSNTDAWIRARNEQVAKARKR